MPGIEPQEIVSRVDDPEVTAAYESDRAEARSAAGSAAELQGKTSTSDGPVRFTAPSVTFAVNGRHLVAGGWQPLAAYDVCVANLAPEIERRAQPEDVAAALAEFPAGLTTYEVATVMAAANDEPDGPGTERSLLELVAEGRARRAPLGDDAAVGASALTAHGRRELVPRGHAELLVDVTQVVLHRLRAEVEGGGGLTRRASLGQGQGD